MKKSSKNVLAIVVSVVLVVSMALVVMISAFADNAASGDEAVTDAPAEAVTNIDEDVTDEPATDEPATDEPATDEPATEEPATDEPATEEPATDEPATKGPEDQYVDIGIVGDINKDGKVNSMDARLALRFSARLQQFSDEELVLADADGDKIVRSRDARLILRVAAKLDKWGENGNIIGSTVKGLLVGGKWGYTVENDFVAPTAAPPEPTTAA